MTTVTTVTTASARKSAANAQRQVAKAVTAKAGAKPAKSTVTKPAKQAPVVHKLTAVQLEITKPVTDSLSSINAGVQGLGAGIMTMTESAHLAGLPVLPLVQHVEDFAKSLGLAQSSINTALSLARRVAKYVDSCVTKKAKPAAMRHTSGKAQGELISLKAYAEKHAPTVSKRGAKAKPAVNPVTPAAAATVEANKGNTPSVTHEKPAETKTPKAMAADLLAGAGSFKAALAVLVSYAKANMPAEKDFIQEVSEVLEYA